MGHQLNTQKMSRMQNTRRGLPRNYGPRTRHYHIKAQAPNQPVLTTQLYFPDKDRNATDFLFRPEFVMVLSPGPQSERGRFDFVQEVG